VKFCPPPTIEVLKCNPLRSKERLSECFVAVVALLKDRLGKARLGSGDITPLLDDWLLDLPWVGARPGADLLGDVNTLLHGLKQRHQFGDVLALLLGLQVASLLWHLLGNSLSLVKALLWARLQLTTRWATKLTWNLLTLGFRRVLLDPLPLGVADLLGPLGTLFLGGVTLGDILALLLLDGLALNNIILNVVLVVPGLTLRLVDSLTLNWTFSIADQRSVAKLDLLLRGNGLVLNETALPEVLLALLFLLRLEVGGVGGVALLAVAMLALDDIIVLGLSDHDNLVNTPLSGSSNGSNVQSHIILTATLTGITGWESGSSMSSMINMVVIMMGMGLLGGTTSIALVEWESSPQVLAAPVGASC